MFSLLGLHLVSYWPEKVSLFIVMVQTFDTGFFMNSLDTNLLDSLCPKNGVYKMRVCRAGEES